MKNLILTFKIKNIEKYIKKNNKVSLIELEYDIQQIIFDNKVNIQDIKSGKSLLCEDSFYQLKFTIDDITLNQRNNIIKEIEKLINIHRAVVEENNVKIYDRMRVN